MATAEHFFILGLDDILPKVDDIITIPDDIFAKVDDISSKLDDIRVQLSDEVGNGAVLEPDLCSFAKKLIQNQNF